MVQIHLTDYLTDHEQWNKLAYSVKSGLDNVRFGKSGHTWAGLCTGPNYREPPWIFTYYKTQFQFNFAHVIVLVGVRERFPAVFGVW